MASPPSIDNDTCRRLLVETKVKALHQLCGAQLVILTDTSTVEQALTVLSEHRILSAPVVAPDEGGAGKAHVGARWPAQLPNSDIMGFVCVNDILNSFLECYAREFSDAAFLDGCGDRNGAGARLSSGGGGGSMLARMRRLEVLGAAFAQQQLRDLACKGTDGDFLHSRHAGEARLLELVMYGFLDPKRRGMHEGEQQSGVVHRVAMFDSGGAITSVISQTDICRFLAQHCDRLGDLATTTMAQLGWDCKPVVSCTPETPALDAMRLMVSSGVSSLAVVTQPHAAAAGTAAAEGAAGAEGEGAAAPSATAGGRLLGNFSASEMRTMTAEHFGALSLPVGEFLALEHDTEYVAANRERLLEEGVLGSPAHVFIRDRLRRARPHAPGEDVGQQLVVASPSSTFCEVVDLIVRHRIHRVYVVNAAEQPVGIVTCTDILRKVVEQATASASPSNTGTPTTAPQQLHPQAATPQATATTA